MTITAQTIITAAAVLSALGGFFAFILKVIHWVEHQKEQDAELLRIETKLDSAIQRLEAESERSNHAIQEEQTLIIYGLLACLKGLKEQGCNGPVTEAINKIDKYINQKAHEQLL